MFYSSPSWVMFQASPVPLTHTSLVPQVFKRRWVMVFLFATYSASNAYQWIHLNIIENVIYRFVLTLVMICYIIL